MERVEGTRSATRRGGAPRARKKAPRGGARGNEKVQRRKERNRGLEEEARSLKQGAHRYHRREALIRRDWRREKELLVEQLNKEQPSD